jgi:hypothetical protein
VPSAALLPFLGALILWPALRRRRRADAGQNPEP